jgi:hypothetical protein
VTIEARLRSADAGRWLSGAAWLLGILALAAFYRFFRLPALPPGLNPDEAMNGNDALASLASGRFAIFYPENYGREGLFIWVVALSQYGLFGLSAAMATMLLGHLLVCWRFSSRDLLTPQLIPLTTLAMVACLCMFENLFNGLPNPLVYVAIGGLLQCGVSPLRGFHAPGVTPRAGPPESISRRLTTGEPAVPSTTVPGRSPL